MGIKTHLGIGFMAQGIDIPLKFKLRNFVHRKYRRIVSNLLASRKAFCPQSQEIGKFKYIVAFERFSML